ncbi:MAG TPA: tetratricopeptide repeat protein, partial [Candidatus Baltobacteraceae bacterium]|nr:tetratricopeptide repeat protein [Candidatus Baltobacteraceae bacterium]
AEPKNFQTAYDIGEAYRMQSFEGAMGYQVQAETAMHWYAMAKAFDRYDGYNDLRTGMCLDWLDRHGESEKFYREAEALDPNGYYTIANIGWHYVQIGDYAAAREWFERSLRLEWVENIVAQSYLDLVKQKLIENASGKTVLLLGF